MKGSGNGPLTATIGEVAEITSGVGFPKERQGKKSGAYPFAKVSDISRAVAEASGHLATAANYIDISDLKSLRARPVAVGSTVFAKIGEALHLNRRAITDVEVVLDNNCMALTPIKDKITPDYLYRFMQTVNLSPFAVATSVPSVRRGDVANISLFCPELPEQRRIAAKLNGLITGTTRAGEELRSIPMLLQRYRAAILATAFSSLSKAGEKTELGTLAEFVTSGSRGWAKYYAEDGASFIRVGNVRRGKIDLDLSELQHVLPPRGAEGERTSLQEQDIVVTVTADLGRVGLVPSGMGKAYVNQHVALVRLKRPENARFIAWYLTSAPGQAQLFEGNRGMTRAGLGLDDIRDVAIPLSSLAEHERVVRTIETALDWLDRITAEYTSAFRLLPRLDQAILSKAFRGRIVTQDPNYVPIVTTPNAAQIDRASLTKARGLSSRSKISTQINRVAMQKNRVDADVKDKPYLRDKLRTIGGKVKVEQLYQVAQLPLVDFYKQLSAEFDQGWLRKTDEFVEVS
jgi:type I restriction enzyme S subunit